MAGVLFAALVGTPSLARAATVSAPLAAAVAEVAGRSRDSRTPVRAAPGDSADYAARETAAPELSTFKGGRGGIYIGGGTVVLVLLVVLIVILI